MSVLVVILVAIVAGNLFWWRYADRRLRPLAFGGRWRALHAAFVAAQLLAFGVIIASRITNMRLPLPQPLVAGAFLWQLLVLPAAVIVVLVMTAWEAASRQAGRRAPPAPGAGGGGAEAAVPANGGGSDRPRNGGRSEGRSGTKAPSPAEFPGFPAATSSGLSRRQILAAAAVAVPPLACAGLTSYALGQLHAFRVRELAVPVPNLPSELDGLTIAHVSDAHVGRFTTPATLRRVADAVNGCRADLVLFTGDLIDYSLADLPAGLDFLRHIDPRGGMFLVEGNHDLFESRRAFDDGVRGAGLNLLLNSAADITVRGAPVQILGIRWGRGPGHGPAAFEDNCAETLAQRRRGSFPILLAHHPHAFDAAAAAGVPLTLAGHTHGGQLNLTANIGFGRAYKYWSGLYRNGPSRAVVSNGCGNWFPLRINAPAEVGKLTLRRAE